MLDPRGPMPLALGDESLLERRATSLNHGDIAKLVTGRRVLVTGAGGSIGSELCRQIVRHRPASLIMLDRDDSALHGVLVKLEGRASMDDERLALVDITDARAVRKTFERHRPDIVFHAAALKHVAILEQHLDAAWTSNVLGTRHVIEAAIEAGAEYFVNISTDKAAAPASVLGLTKRITERMTAGAAALTGATYVSVRFGNVLGSRGSVLETFRAQVEAGWPLTVTSPSATRYFMTVRESALLTLQAITVGRPGEVLILDMGEPVRIADLALRIAPSHRDSWPIEYTGLRPGEKIHEVLLGPGERDERPNHPLIIQCPVPPLHPSEVLAAAGEDCVTRATLSGLAGWADEPARRIDIRRVAPGPASVAHAPAASPDVPVDAGLED
jgi:FlaA1/EpsC-like NDP-sugar epimerase